MKLLDENALNHRSAALILLIFGLTQTPPLTRCEVASFNFIEFAYKETSKNEMTYQEFEQACQQSPECQQSSGVALEHCVRNCISPSCYQDLYRFDELEEGEIDVRLNSFKGCFIQRLNRQRS
ncbi:uncharacterized protein LOC132204127 [Neocloeon triangulifer]|uniref:uncharacterized protein LOC132204127 n=1 Tax=Neocloeon triangulifer TaxID=2078957 RepID=UPI00286ECEB9|nr:uncharacterized protein LOC132204127 [Neocloeon triangulifer]